MRSERGSDRIALKAVANDGARATWLGRTVMPQLHTVRRWENTQSTSAGSVNAHCQTLCPTPAYSVCIGRPPALRILARRAANNVVAEIEPRMLIACLRVTTGWCPLASGCGGYESFADNVACWLGSPYAVRYGPTNPAGSCSSATQRLRQWR